MIANIVWISTLTKQFNLLIMPNVSQYICGNVATVRVLLFLMHAIFIFGYMFLILLGYIRNVIMEDRRREMDQGGTNISHLHWLRSTTGRC